MYYFNLIVHQKAAMVPAIQIFSSPGDSHIKRKLRKCSFRIRSAIKDWGIGRRENRIRVNAYSLTPKNVKFT